MFSEACDDHKANKRCTIETINITVACVLLFKIFFITSLQIQPIKNLSTEDKQPENHET